MVTKRKVRFWTKVTIFLKLILKDHKLSRPPVKVEMRNSVTRNCEGWNRNAENQCGFAGNLGGNLGIAAEMT